MEYCKNKYEIYNISGHKLEQTEETMQVIKAIGKEHPVFIVQENLFSVEEDLPF